MTTRPNLSRIMQKAWMSAKVAARRHGGKASQYVAETMKLAWAEEKALVARCNEMESRMAAAVAEIKALPKAPVAPAYYGSRRSFTRPVLTRRAA